MPRGGVCGVVESSDVFDRELGVWATQYIFLTSSNGAFSFLP